MNITVQQVFDQAIHLLDEQNESTGETLTVDTGEYKRRTISILNTVIPRLGPYSSNYRTGSYARPTPDILYCDNYKEPDFNQVIMLDDAMCLSLLPLYLAAQLISAENEFLAQWFMSQYRELLAEFKRNLPASFEPISTPYGLF